MISRRSLFASLAGLVAAPAVAQPKAFHGIAYAEVQFDMDSTRWLAEDGNTASNLSRPQGDKGPYRSQCNKGP